MNEVNKEYRCMKCEGKNVLEHGLYCPNRKPPKNPKTTNRLTE